MTAFAIVSRCASRRCGVPFDAVEEGSQAEFEGVVAAESGVEARFVQGQATLDDILAAQDRFDNHFLDSPEWRAARS